MDDGHKTLYTGISWLTDTNQEEMSDVKVAEVKDVDVSDTETDSDSVEGYGEQVPNSTKRSTVSSHGHIWSCTNWVALE